jgi:hypothetical protein
VLTSGRNSLMAHDALPEGVASRLLGLVIRHFYP